MPVTIRGKEYTTVAERLAILHADDEKSQVSIETQVVLLSKTIEINELRRALVPLTNVEKVLEHHIDWIVRQCQAKEVLVKATLTIGEQTFTGHAHEVEDLKNPRAVNATSFIENAETSSIGRALAASGRAGQEFASADELVNALNKEE